MNQIKKPVLPAGKQASLKRILLYLFLNYKPPAGSSGREAFCMSQRLSVLSIARGDKPTCQRCGRRVYSWRSISTGYGCKCRLRIARILGSVAR